MNRTLPAVALLALAAVLAIAGCGSSSNSNSSSGEGGAYGSGGGATKPAASPTGSGSAATVSLASVPKVGQVIVDSKGFTLYDFHKDKGTKSSCYGACVSVWPPLTTSGAPKATGGAEASKLGTTKRTDGTTQVTYAGHPIYTYTVDKKPGEANGNDFSSFSAQWYALKANGEEAGG